MKSLTLRDFDNLHKEKRYIYNNVLSFINSDRCYDGMVCVLYGLRRTGKTTIMEQIMTDNADKFSFLFLEATKKDTMDDVYSYLDKAVDDKVDCVFIDEITNIPDFIDNSALLADIYAKEGLKIILAGTDSLSFVFAESSSLYGRTENISSTYISFEEHCNVLGTKDMDDYISYGGLMKKGASEKDRIVHDFQSACRYLDDAVSGNISRSILCLSKYSNDTELSEVTLPEMRAVLEKMVEKYSGVLNTALANEELRKIVLSFPTDRQDFKALEGAEIFKRLRANKPDIVKEFAKAINADTQITHKWNEGMILRLENELIRLGFISATNNQEFIYDENFGWRSMSVHKEYYLIQPAIKYYHLKKALDFVETNEHYNSLSEVGKQYVMDKLDSKIRGDMTEQIVVYEISKALSSDRYFVCKVSFSNSDPNKEKGEYDMLIYDKAKNAYFAFEIKHTTTPYSKQYNHLLNENFKEIIDYKYGDKENVSVLYNGVPFDTSSGVLYLNISDFIREITRCGDPKQAIQKLSSDLPIRDLETEEKKSSDDNKGSINETSEYNDNDDIAFFGLNTGRKI
ncbi:MAG: ATP-binding protein [Eubacterium sp.]|nr:ATP-binding protein [Eubacterium sp.]